MILEKKIFNGKKKDFISRFFSLESFSPQKINFGESNNFWKDLVILNKVRDIAFTASQEGYRVCLYEEFLNVKNYPDSKEYTLYLKKENKFSISLGLLNLKSRFTDKLNKINLPLYSLN
ncbi:hypothetical protein HYS72_01400 [Candidatus Pacearchaeota archaeon]|nr:hypothetical protein [Candidatus Pacearchaeota archaeon]MBI2056991.1 hypothetical protein [Candidatus Pacearchaeota archaeon]